MAEVKVSITKPSVRAFQQRVRGLRLALQLHKANQPKDYTMSSKVWSSKQGREWRDGLYALDRLVTEAADNLRTVREFAKRSPNARRTRSKAR